MSGTEPGTPLERATERLAAALRQRAAGAPLSEEALARAERSQGAPIPAPWRRVLLACGASRGYRLPRGGGSLTLSPDDAAEHQAETDDGYAIARRGLSVIGYIEGVGDCVVIEHEGDDPGVAYHTHGEDWEEHPLGPLSAFVDALAAQVEAGDPIR